MPMESELEERGVNSHATTRACLSPCSELDSLPSLELGALSGALSLEVVRKAMDLTGTLVVGSSLGLSGDELEEHSFIVLR